MKTNKIIKAAAVLVSATALTACNWVKEPTPGVTNASDYFLSGGETAIYNVNADYVPMVWEYNNEYFSEWYFGDIMSDDALKGGETISDGPAAYDLDNFKINSNNNIILQYYRAQYEGIGRCNYSLQEIPKVECDEVLTPELKQRLLGEVYFLRAYYYFRLVRLFGAIPVVTTVQNDDSQWQKPRTPVDKVYTLIVNDLEEAEKRLWQKSKTSGTDLGRATKGAAQAMLTKVYLYQKNYEKAEEWGAKFMEEQVGEYSLVPNYADNFTLAGENNAESIFELQYVMEGSSDYASSANSAGGTRGTFTTILTRSRTTVQGSGCEGWGWNKPTQNLYNEYEDGDPRRDATILYPDKINGGEVSKNDEYLGTYYVNRKTGLYSEDGASYTYKLTHASRGDLNKKEIRYSDFLLMYAEACEENGNTTQAEKLLEMVRSRARQGDASVLPAYPGYTIKINGVEKTPTLKEAIRHERRMELAMEGIRWFDLVRWGVAVEVMNAYRETENPLVKGEMSEMQEKHMLLPIPAEEVKLNPMENNPGY